MDTVHQGIRAGDIEKDTYERLICSHCEASLATQDNPEGVGKLRACPECGREYKQIS
jgi:methionyl-tRNA synthetase